MPCKFFVGCLLTNLEATTDELRQQFSEYGDLSDIYIPRPYHGFRFVTYVDGYEGQKMMSQQHMIHGSRLNITVTQPKDCRITSHKPFYSRVRSYNTQAGTLSTGYIGYNPQHYGYDTAISSWSTRFQRAYM